MTRGARVLVWVGRSHPPRAALGADLSLVLEISRIFWEHHPGVKMDDYDYLEKIFHRSCERLRLLCFGPVNPD